MGTTLRIGDQGDRVVVIGSVLSVERIPTEFGDVALIKIRTVDQALAYWRSSHGEYADTIRAGDPITVRATIDRYKLIDTDLWCRLTNGRLDEEALALT